MEVTSGVLQHGSYRVNGGGSLQCGIAEYQWRTQPNVRTHGGGVVWRHGGVIGRICEVRADLNYEDCSAVRWR
jgi:hypothetical protein